MNKVFVDRRQVFRVAITGLFIVTVLNSLISKAASQVVQIEPPDTTMELYDTFDLDIIVDENVLLLKGYDVKIVLNPSVLSVHTITEGPLLPFGGPTFFAWRMFGPDTIQITDAILGADLFVNGPGILATMTFESIGYGQSAVHFAYSALRNTVNDPLPHTTTDGSVTIPYTNGPLFIRGDVNADSVLTMGDALFELKHLYVPGSPPPPCMKAADTDDNQNVVMSDALYILKYLYVPGSPAPPLPFPDCGSDPTPDQLGCESHPCMESFFLPANRPCEVQ